MSRYVSPTNRKEVNVSKIDTDNSSEQRRPHVLPSTICRKRIRTGHDSWNDVLSRRETSQRLYGQPEVVGKLDGWMFETHFRTSFLGMSIVFKPFWGW